MFPQLCSVCYDRLYHGCNLFDLAPGKTANCTFSDFGGHSLVDFRGREERSFAAQTCGKNACCLLI